MYCVYWYCRGAFIVCSACTGYCGTDNGINAVFKHALKSAGSLRGRSYDGSHPSKY